MSHFLSPDGLIYSKQLPLYKNKRVTLLGKLVTVKPVRTVKGESMSFWTFLDQNGDWLDTVRFPDSHKKYPFQGSGFYRLTGKVTEEFGVYSVEVAVMKAVGLKGL